MSSNSAQVADLPGAPFDIEFFFDPLCPFAWQTSVWIRRVAELRGISVGWRFVSLKFINEDDPNLGERQAASHDLGLGYHRICAAAREEFGNEAVADLYRCWGEAIWYNEIEGDVSERFSKVADETTYALAIESAGLPEDLIKASSDSSWDALIRSETEEAFRRTGPDVGTPIITYDPPNGSSLFGPVISSIPDDETAVAFYDALRTFVDFPAFSELKRSKRPKLDLPLFN